MNGRRLLFGLLVASIAAFGANCRSGGAMADSIIINANVRTGDPAKPAAEAVALRGDRILLVGSNAEVKRAASRGAEIIDAEGALVLPGFIDSHVHLAAGGFGLLGPDLREAASKEEFVARVAARVRDVPPGEWISAGTWDNQKFQPVEMPRREWIDAVTPDHPVCLDRMDLHTVLVNTAALRRAGIDRTTTDPPGGEIARDPATGEPTGILKDAACDLIRAVIPEPSSAQKKRAVEAALRAAAARGLTSVHDVAGEESLGACRDLLREGRLTVRVRFYLPIAMIDRLADVDVRAEGGSGFLRFGGLKGFVDGSLGSQTAWFEAPYADDPSSSGFPAAGMFPEGLMERRIRAADAAGLQTAVHAIGDRAVAALLDLYERTAADGRPRDRRFRMEHAQHVRPADFPRFARLGVIASVQPYHLVDDGRWAEAKIGPERARTSFAFRSFLEAGAVLAFGSDWPVAPLDPILGVWAAATRATIDGRRPEGWIPEQKISVEDAVRAFTAGGAYAEFAERDKGRLVPGAWADLTVLDMDLFRVPPERVREARVLRTILGGRTVFEA